MSVIDLTVAMGISDGTGVIDQRSIIFR